MSCKSALKPISQAAVLFGFSDNHRAFTRSYRDSGLEKNSCLANVYGVNYHLMNIVLLRNAP